MSYIGVCFEITTGCTKCNQPVPLNGATESVLCDACQTPVQTPVALWQSILSDNIAAGAGMAEDEGSQSTIMTQGHTLKVMYGRQMPRCSNDDCKTTFPDEILQAGVEQGSSTFHCPACGTAAAARRPPDWFAQIHPGVVLLVRESVAADKVETMRGSEPVPFHCYHCGGGLPVDGTARQINCNYCGNSLMIPDEIWVRLNPVSQMERWYAVIDVGSAVGVLPESIWDFGHIATDMAGNLYLAYLGDDEGDAGHRARIVRVNRQGMLEWIQDGIDFEDDECALVTSRLDGTLLLVDGQKGFARSVDPNDGQPIRTYKSPKKEDDGSLNVRDWKHVAVDMDGTILVARDWSDGNYGELRRFGPDGQRVDLWPTKSKGSVKFEKPGNCPSKLGYGPKMTIGWNGYLYMVDSKMRYLLCYDRAGTLMAQLQTGVKIADDLNDLAVDRQGMMYLLFKHKEKIGDEKFSHIARMHPDGRFEVWIGPHSMRYQYSIGTYQEYLAVAPDGTLHVTAGIDNLRTLDAEGMVLWRNAGTIQGDKDRAEELAKQRRGKKKVKDKG